MFFKKKKYITINNPQKSRKNYDLTYDNVAIPEVHTHEASDSTNAVSSNASVDYDNLATKIKENAPDLVKSLLGEQVRQAYASLLNESDDEDDDTEEKD